MDFEGKVALVTGATSEIGRATVVRLPAPGCAVGVLGQEPDRVHDGVEEARRAGGLAHPLLADVTSEAEMKAATDSLVGEFDRLDYLLANADINSAWDTIDEITPADWDRTILDQTA